MDKLKINYRN